MLLERGGGETPRALGHHVRIFHSGPAAWLRVQGWVLPTLLSTGPTSPVPEAQSP